MIDERILIEVLGDKIASLERARADFPLGIENQYIEGKLRAYSEILQLTNTLNYRKQKATTSTDELMEWNDWAAEIANEKHTNHNS